jgi:ubiquinone/menaquinone biosynthesis C-methylase UbiE
MPFSARSFDAAFTSFTLMLFEDADMRRVLAECRCVLERTGRLAVVSLTKSGGTSRLRSLYEWAHRRGPRWIDCRPIDLTDALCAAGFEAVVVEPGSVGGLPIEMVLAFPGRA